MSGFAAEFTAEDALLGAVRRLRDAGLRRIEAYTPYPVAALDDLLPRPPPVLPVLVFAAGMLGLVGGFLLQWYGAAVSYPINIGGRPPASWPSFIPIAFEDFGLLCAGNCGLFVTDFSALAGAAAPIQAIQALPDFDRVTQDRFYLVVDGADPRLASTDVELLVKDLAPCRLVQWQR